MLSVLNSEVEPWERLAKTDALWAVISTDDLRAGALTQEAQARFWRSGEAHVDHVMSILRAEIDPTFHPRASLDFGCGVGRNLVPLARQSSGALGLDISPTMVDKARERLGSLSIENATAQVVGEGIEGLTPASFDFVHCVLVFQHIAPAHGLALLRQLLELLEPGGKGFVQFYCHGKETAGVAHLRSLRFAHGRLNQLCVATGIGKLKNMVMLHEYAIMEVLDALHAGRVDKVVMERTGPSALAHHLRLYFSKAELGTTTVAGSLPLTLELRT
ncbi:MAG: class I SAM-dependent methyltransferase [Acidimicrobiales bacterium]